MPSRTAAVPGGLRAMRARLRTLGPVVGLIPPAVLGLLSLLLTRNSTSAGRGIAGFALGVLAAPGLLVAGVPLSNTSHYAPAIAGSAAFWFLLGLFAAVRATRRPVAGWGDFWRDYAWLAVPVWIGVGAALFVADLALGNALF